MNTIFKELQPYVEKATALLSAIGLIQWDNETLAPEDAADYAAKVVGILSQEQLTALINPEVKSILEGLKAEPDLDDFEKRVVKKLTKLYKKTEKVPAEEQRAHSELVSRSQNAWQKAKKASDYSMFAPYLEKLIASSKKLAEYAREDGQKLYDVMLDDYEETFDMEALDRFFGKMRKEIVPLLAKIREKEAVDYPFLYAEYDIEKQKEVGRWLAGYIGFNWKRGVLAESEHPFTTNWNNCDVRITTHYYPNDMFSSIFSTIHEGGHALYEQGIADQYNLTLLGGGTSCGMHESQSRFMENIIGRSEEFWKPLYQKLQEMFPEQLGNVGLTEFFHGICQVKPGLIRIEADELTYCLHIMIRYELEKMMFEGEVDLAQLPSLWNQKYQEYLGISASDEAHPLDHADAGVLQDIHWACGNFGYFPSYALGNAFGAQIYHQMKKDLDVSRLLSERKISEIVAYLREHIHQYGSAKEARELLKNLTGEEFNPDYYIEYLKEKYGSLYGLE
jgi:carboxypeptidase Taq